MRPYADVVAASDDASEVSGVTSVRNELLVGTIGGALVEPDLAARCMGLSTPTLSCPRAPSVSTSWMAGPPLVAMSDATFNAR